MALLRWIHMRKLVPLTELLSGVRNTPSTGPRPAAPKPVEAFTRKAAPVVPPVERRAPQEPVSPKPASARAGEGGRDAFLLEIRKSKPPFYNTFVVAAQQIEFGPEKVTFSFLPAQRMQLEKLTENRQWLEQIAAVVAGKKMPVVAVYTEPIAAGGGPAASQPKQPPDLKTTAMGDSAVQAMLDVFPAEIENVEEIE
jgi:hypothetical protein